MKEVLDANRDGCFQRSKLAHDFFWLITAIDQRGFTGLRTYKNPAIALEGSYHHRLFDPACFQHGA
jgi:hypothetical protein